MTKDAGKQSVLSSRRAARKIGLLMPLLGVTSSLLAVLLVYLGYDYAATRAAPCESIFSRRRSAFRPRSAS
jgi:hypothetical protein